MTNALTPTLSREHKGEGATHPHPLDYRPEIDGLRALAVGLVVLYHLGFGIPGGYVGVDVFFVISGFLITTLVRRDVAAGTFTLVGFYERRARRILPASLVMTAAVLAYGWWRVLPSDLEAVGRSAIAHTLFVANVHFYGQATNYFGGPAGGMPLLHTWSLGVEEQFYFAFPLLLIVCRLATRRYFWRVSAGVVMLSTAASLAWGIYSVPYYPLSGFFLLPARAWELLAGAGLAAVPPWRAPRWLREIVSVAAVALVLASALLYSAATLFPGLAALPPCLGAVLFVWACHGHSAGQSFVGRLFATRGPVFIGRISYSLYLWHWPVWVFAGYWRLTPLTMPERLAVLGVSFAAAVLSWRFIETPFRKRALLAGRWKFFATVAGGTAAVLLAGIVCRSTGGLPRRFGDKVLKIDEVRRERRSLAQLVAGDVVHDRLTRIGIADDKGPVDLLVWGDSHAGAALPAFDALCRLHGVRGRAATHSSMAPLIDYAIESGKAFRPTTIRYNQAVVDYVKRHKVPKVVLVNYWKRDIEADPAALAEAAGRTIAALREAGATVYVMLQVPGYAVPVPKALACEAVFGQAVPGWRMTLAGFRAEQAVMYGLASKYESADVHFIDTAAAFAGDDGGPLRTTDQGRPMYFDNHHLTSRASKRVLGPLLERYLFGGTVVPPAPATTDGGRDDRATD